jgi:hypothetical protein
MKKIVSVLSTLAVLFAANLSISTTSAKAGYWTSTPQYGGGTIHRYTPTYNYNHNTGSWGFR